MRPSKFTTSQKKKAVAKLAKGVPAQEISNEYGIHPRTIYLWKESVSKSDTAVSSSKDAKTSKTPKRVKAVRKQTSLQVLKKENSRLKSTYNTLVDQIKTMYQFIAA